LYGIHSPETEAFLLAHDEAEGAVNPTNRSVSIRETILAPVGSNGVRARARTISTSALNGDDTVESVWGIGTIPVSYLTDHLAYASRFSSTGTAAPFQLPSTARVGCSVLVSVVHFLTD